MAKRSLTRIARLRYWREADAQIIVESWRSSGDSQARFAQRYKIKVERLRRWAARLSRESAVDSRDAPPAMAGFHPVRVIGAEVVGHGYGVEIDLTDAEQAMFDHSASAVRGLTETLVDMGQLRAG